METIKNYVKLEELIGKKNIIIDCYTDWCGPCKLFGPIFEQCEKENDNISFYKINADKSRMLAKKLGIMSVPTTIIFKNGKEIKRQSGFMDEETLNKFINE